MFGRNFSGIFEGVWPHSSVRNLLPKCDYIIEIIVKSFIFAWDGMRIGSVAAVSLRLQMQTGLIWGETYI